MIETPFQYKSSLNRIKNALSIWKTSTYRKTTIKLFSLNISEIAPDSYFGSCTNQTAEMLIQQELIAREIYK
jgi:hypothetical protein